MPTIRQIQLAHIATSIGGLLKPKESASADPHLRLVKPRMSSNQNILETARHGEVTHFDEADYYNPHLWRDYKDL